MYHNLTDLRRSEYEALGEIYISNCYYNDKSVWEIINEVDTMDGNTAPTEGQGLNVQGQRRNKKSPG